MNRAAFVSGALLSLTFFIILHYFQFSNVSQSPRRPSAAAFAHIFWFLCSVAFRIRRLSGTEWDGGGGVKKRVGGCM